MLKSKAATSPRSRPFGSATPPTRGTTTSALETGFREQRGIYRLALYPSPDRPDLILWWLWSRGRSDTPVGVFSHRTALSLHELTDTNPAKIDLTVPPTFRKGTAIPSILRLHYSEVRADERESVAGVPVTNALRTIIDVWREDALPKPMLRTAFHEASRRGILTKRQIALAGKDRSTFEILRALERAKK